MDKKKLLGRRIKELIKKKNISQEKLAELIGIEPTALSNIVTGRNYPLMSTLEKLLQVLEVDFSEVFNFEHHNDNKHLQEMVDYFKNVFNRLVKFIKNKMFGKDKEREDYWKVSKDMYEHGIFSDETIESIKDLV